jgi:hypothetical protein
MCSYDGLNVPLHDSALHDEMTLLVALMIAANESAIPLDRSKVDCLLGVRPARDGGAQQPRTATGDPRSGVVSPTLTD